MLYDCTFLLFILHMFRHVVPTSPLNRLAVLVETLLSNLRMCST